MRRLVLAGLLLVICGGCGPKPPTLAGGKPVQHWVETLEHSTDVKQRKEAAFKLGNVGTAEPAAFPALVAALKDSDAKVRCEAILALLKFGAEAQDAVPVLTELRELDADSKVRTYAERALEKLQGKE
jgi:HEAT repeat protein